MRSSEQGLGPLQKDVLEYVWERPDCSVRECRDDLASTQGREYAYTTIQTVFDALHRKRLVSRRRKKMAFHYTARQSRVGMLSQQIRQLIARFGKAPEPVASSLVDALEGGEDGGLQALVEELKERGYL
ncbi:BlaI/MecI/CopY family transcriptional regulator [bacterium]|nr:BlaI/MecI/CopY family transcriptional regulator [bacterium]